MSPKQVFTTATSSIIAGGSFAKTAAIHPRARRPRTGDRARRIKVSLLHVTRLGQKPLHEVGFRVGMVPRIVPDTGILGVANVTSERSEGGGHAAGFRDGHGPVLGSVKDPD